MLGADLKAFAGIGRNWVDGEGDGPMGPTRMRLHKPVIAAIEGHAVAGRPRAGDLVRFARCRQRCGAGCLLPEIGVPLIDLGTIRLPRLIGQSRESPGLDSYRTRCVRRRSFANGLSRSSCRVWQALTAAIDLAEELAAFPQLCMRNDRLSVYEQWDLERRRSDSQ